VYQEKRLAEECSKNNPVAQKELYDTYSDIIMAICYRYTRNMAVAEDMMQESLIKILTRIGRFRWMNDGCFKAWVKKIAVNTCLTYLEKNQKNRWCELKEEESLIDEEGAEASDSSQELDLINRAELTREEMLEALAEVPDPFRIVFNMHVIEGFRHEDIAGMLKINIKTSKTRLFRARKLLKELLYKISYDKIKNSGR